MSKLFARISGFFCNNTLAGIDKAGNRYFTRKEEIDGLMKEKRWVVFKGEQEPVSIPVEWICWLNGQRKKAPTPEEMLELEARHECVRVNIALLKKEEEERRANEGTTQKVMSSGKVVGPDLKIFIRQFPSASLDDDKLEEASDARPLEKEAEEEKKPPPMSIEPAGSGASYKPGTWQLST